MARAIRKTRYGNERIGNVRVRILLAEVRGGQSTLVSFVFIFLLTVGLAAPIVELTRYTSDALAVASASNDLARVVAEDPSMNEAQRQAFFDRAYPNLAGAAVEVHVSFPRTQAYQHHLPTAEGTWNARPSQTESRMVDVTVSIERPWVTPLSSYLLMLTGTGLGDTYKVEAEGNSFIDDTASSGSW